MRSVRTKTQEHIMSLKSTNRILQFSYRTSLSGKRTLRGCETRLCPSPASPVAAYISFTPTVMTTTDLMAFDQGDLSEAETIILFQRLIDNGTAWKLQGSYGRTAMDLIRCAYCMLVVKGHLDAYGNYVPSRYEAEPGTPGSPEYRAKRVA